MNKNIERFLEWQQFKNWCVINNKRACDGSSLQSYVKIKKIKGD